MGQKSVKSSVFSLLSRHYLSQEQLAREYYVSTGTITSWIKKGKIQPTVTFPFGSKQIYLFSPQDVRRIRQELSIPEHTEETIKQDFFDFLEERDYSLSYKMPFLLSFLKHMNSIGDANIEAVLDDYIAFYADRIEKGLPVDRPTCPYNAKTLQDRKLIKANMLTNPFEKFERKRFLYHSKCIFRKNCASVPEERSAIPLQTEQSSAG